MPKPLEDHAPSYRVLVGRTIVWFDAGTYKAGHLKPGKGLYSDEEGPPWVLMHNPTIVLDDGSLLRFSAEEHPAGYEYGIQVHRLRAPPEHKPIVCPWCGQRADTLGRHLGRATHAGCRAAYWQARRSMQR